MPRKAQLAPFKPLERPRPETGWNCIKAGRLVYTWTESGIKTGIQMLLHYWFLLPVGIVIATLVMSSGVSGATLWVPVYFLWLGFDISLAFWLGLVTVLFGMGSGVHRNMCDGTFNGRLIWRYCLITIPAAIVGALIEPYLGERVLVKGFGAFILIDAIVIGWRTLSSSQDHEPQDSISYARAIIGGLLTGIISIGTGILTFPSILRHRSVQRAGSAVGTATILIFVTSIAATVGRMQPLFIKRLGVDLPAIVAVMLWAAPGVVIGGQCGPRLAQIMPSQRHACLYFCAVLLVVGCLTLARGTVTSPTTASSLAWPRCDTGPTTTVLSLGRSSTPPLTNAERARIDRRHRLQEPH